MTTPFLPFVMKFGKHIKEHRVPEWQEKYIDYSALKKLISSVEKSRSTAALEVATDGVLSPTSTTDTSLTEQLQTFPIMNSSSGRRKTRFGSQSSSYYGATARPPSSFDEYLQSASNSEKLFFIYLDSQVDRTEAFLVENCDQAQARYRALKDQSIIYLARKRDHDDQRNRGKHLQFEFAAAIESDLKKIKNKIGGTLRHMMLSIPPPLSSSGQQLATDEIALKCIEAGKGKSVAIDASSQDSINQDSQPLADAEAGLSSEILEQTSKNL